MKYLVVFVVIASVAAGNLRALEHDDSFAGAFVEMKENSTYHELQTANETIMENRAIHYERERVLTRFNNQKAKLPFNGDTAFVGEIPTYEVQEKEHKDADENDSDPDFDVRIVGGEVSDSNEFPYYVNLFGCGATLIGPDIVIGAAHCGNLVGRTVTIGSVQRVVSVQRLHPNFNSNTMQNDFCLYKLNSPVTTSGATVTVNTDGSRPSNGQALTVMGYGYTTNGSGVLSDRLRDVVVPTVTNCGAKWGTMYNANVMLCAGVGGKDSCNGDSGGPIVIRNGNSHVLVGIVSFGAACADPNYPGVYSRVSSVTAWITTVACNDWGGRVNGLCGSGASPATQPAPAPAPTSSTCTRLTVNFQTDSWPRDNSIVLKNPSSTLWNHRSFQANRDYRYTRCIPNNACTTLDVTDTRGDGLLSSGRLKVTFGSRVMYDSRDVGYGFLMRLGNSC